MPQLKTYTTLGKADIQTTVIVARDEDAYIGRVFEGGLWSFDGGRELLAAALFHPSTHSKRQEVADDWLHKRQCAFRLWRSKDGGKTWKDAGEIFNVPDLTRQFLSHEPVYLTTPIDLVANNAILSSVGIFVENERRVVVHASTDRGKSWSEPHRINGLQTMPHFGQASTVKRIDGETLIFHTVTGPGGRLRPIATRCVVLEQTLPHVSLIPESLDFDRVHPCAVSLADGTLVAAVTEQPSESPGRTLIFRSDDLGRTWDYVTRANEIGAPGHLTLMPDGRLLLTYGWPLPPFRLLARLSADGGATWGPELLLREKGGSADLGSVRSAVRDDGVIVSVYQWNDANEKGRFQGGRRYVAATLWRA